ncbi:MAG: sigma-70 family RNA polymerase sigma factor [Planctomycetes bacterium]|nr:sigma-70 family RNA polymerase sigma factor [Planctomycetota bacterium]
MERRSDPDPQSLLEHSARVRALARALVLDPNEALDIEQTTWRRVLESGRSTFSAAWIAAVVRNVARSRWREGARRSEREQRVATEHLPGASPAEILEREEQRRRLVEHVLALGEPWRTTLVLHYLEERPLREVADLMDAPFETVRARVKRGLELLRERLRRESGPDWAMALLNGLRLETESAGASLAAGGVLAMGTAAKLAVAAALGVLALVLLLRSRASEPAHPEQLEVESAHSARTVLEDESRSSAALPAERFAAPDVQGVAPSLAPDVTPAATGVQLRVLWERDRSPAAEIWVELRTSGDPAPDLQRRRALTDALGQVRFDAVAPGRVRAKTDRGAQFVGELRPGESLEGELLLRDGFSVRGEVVDEHERAVAGAEIWLETDTLVGDGFAVAHTDSRGRFELSALSPDQSSLIGARAPGRAPSAQHILFGGDARVVDLRLVLRAPGDALSVNVVDTFGAPVAGAVACLGEPSWRGSLSKLDDSRQMPPPALTARADAAGRIEFQGVGFGEQPLCVRAPDLAPWQRTVTIGRETSVRVVLEPAVSLRGEVLDADGAPVAGARVAVGPLGEFMEVATLSARDGSFTLRGLAGGSFRANLRAEGVGSAQAQFYAAPGEQLEWRVQLPRGGVIRGRVVAPGLALDELAVVKTTLRGITFEQVSAKLDAEGRFRFEGCEDVDVELTVERSGGLTPLLRQRAVRPSDEELVLALDPATLPSARLRGRVVDERGEPLLDVEVSPYSPLIPHSPIEEVDPQSGRFDLGPFAPGQWGLVVSARGRPALRIPLRTLAAGELVELGDVVVTAGGTLAVALRGLLDTSGAPVRVELDPLDGQFASNFEGPGPLVRSPQLAPGRYEARASTPNAASTTQTVEIVGGSESVLELELTPAAPWSATLVDANSKALDGWVSWTAVNRERAVLARGFESVRGGLLRSASALPAGEIEIALQMQALGLVGVARLPADLGARAAAVPVTMR